VFDIGANEGEKTILFSSLVERVVSVEPSPAAVRILKQRFIHNPKVEIVGKGAGAHAGTAKLQMFGDADCYNTFSPKEITTLDQLIAEYGIPSYIKIDVEGYELEVIKGLRSGIALLSFECNLPQFSAETIECLSILSKRQRSARFRYCVTEPPAKFECQQWMSCDEMSTIVEAGQHRYMEIYCMTA
jgi:FkbM family methyltransferase